MQTFSSSMDNVSKDVQSIWNGVNNQHSSMGGGEQPSGKFQGYDMVRNREEKPKGRPNLAKSLASFGTDFGFVHKSIKQIRQDMEPYFVIIKNVAKMDDKETKKAKEEVQKVEKGFTKIKDDTKDKTEMFNKISTDYGTVADEFAKNKDDTKVARDPHTGSSSGSTKSPDKPGKDLI
jgi:DNA-binding ferritin-like protein